MNITLTPELERLINQKVQSGRYPSANDVVQASLRLLQEQEALEELRREIGLGIEQAECGQTKPFDADDLKRRVREKMAPSSLSRP